MCAGFGLDQLRGDAYPSATSPDGAFEDVPDAELAADPLHVDNLALVSEGAVTRDDKEPRYPRERGDNLLDHAVSKVLLLRIARHVLKRQNRDRWLFRPRQRRGRRES